MNQGCLADLTTETFSTITVGESLTAAFNLVFMANLLKILHVTRLENFENAADENERVLTLTQYNPIKKCCLA